MGTVCVKQAETCTVTHGSSPTPKAITTAGHTCFIQQMGYVVNFIFKCLYCSTVHTGY